MRNIASALLLLALAYVALVAFAWLRQESMLFLPGIPSRQLAATPAHIGLEYEALRIGTADGEELDAWFVPARQERGVLLFFHGNAGNISHRLDSLQIFNRLGLSVLIFDYRGYGRSTGRPSEAGTHEDARAAWRHLVEERGVPAGRIVLFGRSLGGAIAARLATEHRPRALILESTFRSVPALAAEIYWFLPVRWLARIQYPVEEWIRTVDAPLLVIHSREDEIIPFGHGKALYAAAAGPKQLLELRGGHNTGFLVSGSRYIEGIAAFLDGLDT
jgi:uncharacterized protein